MPLPILTTLEDVRDLAGYLRTRAMGATVAEIRAVLRPQVVDPRKINAYLAWGIVERDGERLKLAARGWELARKPSAEAQILRGTLDSIVPYRSVLEWAYHQKMDSITNVDVAAHWAQHHRAVVGTENENTIKDAAVCFFQLAQGALLGKTTLGRRGKPTRLDLDREQLKGYVEAGPSAPPWSGEAAVAAAGTVETGIIVDESDSILPPKPEPVLPPVEPPKTEGRLRVFISHGKNMEIVEQVQSLLTLAHMDSEVAVVEETAAIPVSEKVFDAMQRSDAAIIAVTVEEGKTDAKGKPSINENVLIEIGAAFLLYQKQVVLLWDKRLPVPSNLQGLYRCEFEGQELTWTAGMKLSKAIQNFKKRTH